MLFDQFTTALILLQVQLVVGQRLRSVLALFRHHVLLRLVLVRHVGEGLRLVRHVGEVGGYHWGHGAALKIVGHGIDCIIDVVGCADLEDVMLEPNLGNGNGAIFVRRRRRIVNLPWVLQRLIALVLRSGLQVYVAGRLADIVIVQLVATQGRNEFVEVDNSPLLFHRQQDFVHLLLCTLILH